MAGSCRPRATYCVTKVEGLRQYSWSTGLVRLTGRTALALRCVDGQGRVSQMLDRPFVVGEEVKLQTSSGELVVQGVVEEIQ